MANGYNLYLRPNNQSDFLPVNGVPVSDTLPTGSIVQYTGGTVPAGWQIITPSDTVYIQKIAQPMASINVINQTGSMILETTSFVANTDVEYSGIGYMIDIEIPSMTVNDNANVYFAYSSNNLISNWSGYMQTMNGYLRMYWNAIPADNITLDNIIFQTIS